MVGTDLYTSSSSSRLRDLAQSLPLPAPRSLCLVPEKGVVPTSQAVAGLREATLEKPWREAQHVVPAL